MAPAWSAVAAPVMSTGVGVTDGSRVGAGAGTGVAGRPGEGVMKITVGTARGTGEERCAEVGCAVGRAVGFTVGAGVGRGVALGFAVGVAVAVGCGEGVRRGDGLECGV